MPNLQAVSPSGRGAEQSAPSPKDYERLHKQYIALQRAFENVDLERCHWRRQADTLRNLISQMAQHMKPYEGE